MILQFALSETTVIDSPGSNTHEFALSIFCELVVSIVIGTFVVYELVDFSSYTLVFPTAVGSVADAVV